MERRLHSNLKEQMLKLVLKALGSAGYVTNYEFLYGRPGEFDYMYNKISCKVWLRVGHSGTAEIEYRGLRTDELLPVLIQQIELLAKSGDKKAQKALEAAKDALWKAATT